MNSLVHFWRAHQGPWLRVTTALLAFLLLALGFLAYLGAASGTNGFAASWVLGLSIAVLVLALVYRLVVLVNQANQRAQAVDQQVREAVDAMPAGFALYDEQDRLIMCNKMIEEIFPHLKGQNMIGKTYEQLIRLAMSVKDAPFPVPEEQREQWLAQQLIERRKRTGPVLRAVSGGRWFHHYERLTPSNHLVALRLDVTELVQKSKELELVNEKLARLSTTDGLTSIANRRMFDQTLQKEWLRSARTQQSLSLLMVDIDYFKRYNDRYGHLQGDECLRQVAHILETCVKRSGELVSRYGGEEFALLLPNTSLDEAVVVAQRCADVLAAARIMHADSLVSPWLTLSIGVASTVAAPDLPAETLVKHADVALYSAKASGRARFEVARESLPLILEAA